MPRRGLRKPLNLAGLKSGGGFCLRTSRHILSNSPAPEPTAAASAVTESVWLGVPLAGLLLMPPPPSAQETLGTEPAVATRKRECPRLLPPLLLMPARVDAAAAETWLGACWFSCRCSCCCNPLKLLLCAGCLPVGPIPPLLVLASADLKLPLRRCSRGACCCCCC